MRAFLAYLVFLLVLALAVSPVTLIWVLKIRGAAAWGLLATYFLIWVPLAAYWFARIAMRVILWADKKKAR